MPTQPYRNSSGRTLADYPRPSVAVDTALLSLLEPDVLGVLQVRRENGRGWGLPGTFLHVGERLIDAVRRSLKDKAGVEGLEPRQLHVFDDPERDDRGWVLSVAHLCVVTPDRIETRNRELTRLVPAARPGRLPYGHGDIIARAVDDLRGRYRDRPDPLGLLGAAFTLRELRLAHQAVSGGELQRDTFRRAMEQNLRPTGASVSRGPGRPAEQFRRTD